MGTATPVIQPQGTTLAFRTPPGGVSIPAGQSKQLGTVDIAPYERIRVVTDELQEERDLVGFAFGAHSLNKSVLDVVDVLLLERRVIDENLNGVGAEILDPLSREVRE